MDGCPGGVWQATFAPFAVDDINPLHYLIRTLNYGNYGCLTKKDSKLWDRVWGLGFRVVGNVTLRTLNCGNYGIFLIMDNAGHIYIYIFFFINRMKPIDPLSGP